MKECYEAAGKALGVPIDVQTGTTERDTASQLDVLMTMADMDYEHLPRYNGWMVVHN